MPVYPTNMTPWWEQAWASIFADWQWNSTRVESGSKAKKAKAVVFSSSSPFRNRYTLKIYTLI